MHINRGFLLVTALLAVPFFLAAGCKGPEEEPVEEPAPPAEVEAPPRVPPALQRRLVEAVWQMPADAVVVGTFRSPRAVVDDLNAFMGPEIPTLAAVPLSMLPPGAFDMDQPAAWAVLMGPGGPGVVFLMQIKDADRLAGEAVEEGILKVEPPLPGGPALHVMTMGKWAAFSSGPAALKAFKTADSRFAVPDAMVDRIGESLAWVHVNAEPLAAMAAPLIQQAKAQALDEQTGETSSAEAKFFEWLEDLVKQVQSLEVGIDVDGDHLAVRTGLDLRDDASLLAIARALKPIETYEAGLPPTDRFLLAEWSRIDRAEAGTRLKVFLEPVMDLLFEMLDEAAAKQGGAAPNAAPPAAVTAPLNQAIKEIWAMIDEQGEVLGDRTAVLMEIPDGGPGIYRMTQIMTLKDGAAYRALAEKGAEAIERLYQGILGMVPRTPDAPKVDVAFEYQEGAETIEEVSVDVIRFTFDMDLPEDAPPQARAMFKGMMEGLYGDEGLVMRVAVCEDRAVLTVGGGTELMARAIRNLRDGAGDLAKQKAVSAALARVPENSSAVTLISLPAYAYLVSATVDQILPTTLPPEIQEIYQNVPLPHLSLPALEEPTLASVRVEGNTVRFDLDVPATELGRALPAARHLYSRIMFYAFHSVMRMRMQMGPPTPPPTPEELFGEEWEEEGWEEWEEEGRQEPQGEGEDQPHPSDMDEDQAEPVQPPEVKPAP